MLWSICRDLFNNNAKPVDGACDSNGCQPYCADVNTLHETRCVMDWRNGDGAGFQIKVCNLGGKRRPFWRATNGPGFKLGNGKAKCQHGLTYNQAVKMCNKMGARLPTKAEALANCAAGTGCGHDADLIWTSSSTMPTAKQLTSKKGTCKDIVRPTFQPNEYEYCVSPLEQHESRCCSDKAIRGYKKKKCNGKNLWTESDSAGFTHPITKKKGCQHDLNWAQANKLCKSMKARLCTRKEIESKCTAGTGCQHDSDLIWASTSSLNVRPSLPPKQSKKVKAPTHGFEMGTVTMGNGPVRIVLKSNFKNPVVILGAPTRDKNTPDLVARIKRRGWWTADRNEKKAAAFRPDWFDIYLDLPNHAKKGGGKGGGHCRGVKHAPEKVSYAVFEKDMGKVQGKGKKKAWYQASKTNSNKNFNWKTVKFPSAINNPIVMTQVQSHSGNDWVKTRMRKINNKQFQFKLEETGIDKAHNKENVGWVAIPKAGMSNLAGQGGMRLKYQAIKTGKAVTHAPYQVKFASGFKSNPVILTAMQTFAGGDPTHMRIRKLSKGSVHVNCEEEQCSDREVKHAKETVAVLAIGLR